MATKRGGGGQRRARPGRRGGGRTEADDGSCGETRWTCRFSAKGGGGVSQARSGSQKGARSNAEPEARDHALCRHPDLFPAALLLLVEARLPLSEVVAGRSAAQTFAARASTQEARAPRGRFSPFRRQAELQVSSSAAFKQLKLTTTSADGPEEVERRARSHVEENERGGSRVGAQEGS